MESDNSSLICEGWSKLYVDMSCTKYNAPATYWVGNFTHALHAYACADCHEELQDYKEEQADC